MYRLKQKIALVTLGGYLKNFALALLLLVLSDQLQAQLSHQNAIKARFLYNFTHFVEWPSTVFAESGAPFVIGILGDDPFGSQLDEDVLGEKVKGHPIAVERYQDVKDIINCHILFINSKDDAKIKEILGALPGKNILTVSDMLNFTTIGGIIRFITIKNKIKLQINLPASKNAELNISPKLLQVADIVR